MFLFRFSLLSLELLRLLLLKLFLNGFFLLRGDVGVNGGEPTADRLIEERLDDDFKFGLENGFFLLGDLSDMPNMLRTSCWGRHC